MTTTVTVFSISTCRFCDKAKRILRDHGADFVEINLDDFPSRRKDMLAVADAMSVPQVFVWNTHVGGADALEALAAAGELDELLARPSAPASNSADDAAHEDRESLDPRLAPPQGPPEAKQDPSPRRADDIEANGRTHSLVALVKVIREDLGIVFSGRDLAALLARKFELAADPASDAALLTGRLADRLVELGAVAPKKGESAFAAAAAAPQNPTSLTTAKDKFAGDRTKYCLLEAALGAGSLNSFRVWTDRVDDPLVIVTALKKQLGSVLSRHRGQDGLMDYLGAVADPDFAAFDEAACELQRVSLGDMDEKTRLAFVINLYNLLTLHAFAKVGVPSSNMERTDFFDFVGYTLAGDFYSFNALENGVLRANRNTPFHLGNPIPRGDSRLRAVLSSCNPALHACISCGASSCPPIKRFTAQAIEEEMQIAAQAFFELDENCTVDLAARTVTLTKIISWYQVDFGADTFAMLRTIRAWLRGQKAADLDTLLSSPGSQPPSIAFSDYNWSTDARTSRAYVKQKSTPRIIAHMLFGGRM